MKIDSFNKRLIAIILSLILLSVIGVSIVALYDEFYRPMYDRRPVDVTVDNTIHPLVTNYKTPTVLDSTKAWYLIPVGQILDGRARENHSETEELLNTKNSSNRFYRTISDRNNNLIFRDFVNHTEHIIFNQKVSFNNWYTTTHNGSYFIFMEVVTRDSNKDGELNQNDQKNLAIFNVDSLDLQIIDQAHLSVSDVFRIHNSPMIGVHYQSDLNQDNKWIRNDDPLYLFQYDLDSGTLSSMFEPSTLDQAQTVLESTLEKGQ